mmetsp:Transcript_13458/g.22112  ORF Transcript_13458/g.22112 Transcript_13458/m.22112 type:complete len:374 (-) Transcript_13458:370-1491(-)
MVQRGVAVVVLDVGVGAGLQQCLHDGVLAPQRRQRQRGEAVVVPPIHRRARRQQLGDRPRAALPGGDVQGVVAVPARGGHVRALGQQHTHDPVAAPFRGVRQRREPAPVPRLHRGPRRDEALHRPVLVLDAGRVQRRQPVDAPSGQVGPFGDEEVDDRQVAVLRRHINGHHPIVLCLVDICSLVCQILDDVEVAHLAGGEQGADAVGLGFVAVHLRVLDQNLDDLKVAVLARLVEGGDPVVHGRVRALLAPRQRADGPHHLGVAQFGGHDDGRGRVALAQVRVHPLLAQVLHDLQPVVLAGHEEPRGAVQLLLVHVAVCTLHHVPHDAQVPVLAALEEGVALRPVARQVWVGFSLFNKNFQTLKLLVLTSNEN